VLPEAQAEGPQRKRRKKKKYCLTFHVVVFVVLVVGPISTAAMKAYCTLTPSGIPSFISTGAAH
jgi:hypothetical protein